MCNKLIYIFIIISSLLLVSSFISSVTAVKDIEINDWEESDVNNLFKGNIVNNVQLEDGDTVKFNTSIKNTYTNLSLTVKNKVSIYGNGVTFTRDVKTGTAMVINNSNIFINDINFVNYSSAIQKTSTTAVNDITIDGCKFDNIGDPIIFSFVFNLVITNNNISNGAGGTGIGIKVVDSSFIYLLNNNITRGLHYGIYFGNTNNSVIGSNKLSFDSVNTISNPGNVYGILVSNSNNVSVCFNNVSDFYESIVSGGGATNTYIYNNTVDHCGWGIKYTGSKNGYAYNNTVKNCYNIQSKGTGTGFCIINNAFNITAEDNIIFSNNNYGIEVKNSNGVYLINNEVFNHTRMLYGGINFENNTDVQLIGNKIYNNRQGISFSNAHNDVLISKNSIYNSTTYGIYSSGASTNFMILNNSIYGNGYQGVYFSSSNNRNFTIFDNDIYQNLRDGFYLRGSNFTIDSNRIYKNSYNGIDLGTSSSRSQNNTIINNVIYNNTYNGIHGFVNYNDIVNNKIYNNSREGINLTGNYNNITGGNIFNNIFNGINLYGNWTTIKDIDIYSNLKNGVIFNSIGTNNLLNNSNISSNSLSGILMQGVNDTVQSSNILKNIVNGFNVTGKETNIIYNRIYQNGLGMYNKGNNTISNFNWWGLNDITNQNEDYGENLNFTTWYVLHLAANELNSNSNASKNCSVGEIVNLTYSLETNDFSLNNPSRLPYFTVSVFTSLGDNITADIREFGLNILVSENELSNVDSGFEDYILHYIRSISDDEDIIIELFMELLKENNTGENNISKNSSGKTHKEKTEINENNAEKTNIEENYIGDTNFKPIPIPIFNNDNNTETINNKINNHPFAFANMEKTGLPFVLILAVILFFNCLLICYRKK